MMTFATSREIPVSAEEIFAAFTDPVRLARWWGPAGFTNTFRVCEFWPGGRWEFTMHGPDGAKFPNESEFAEVEAPSRVVIQHGSGPRYRLTISLVPAGAGTRVSWSQVFENSEFAKRFEHVIVPANEQNLDRLTAEVMGRSHAS